MKAIPMRGRLVGKRVVGCLWAGPGESYRRKESYFQLEHDKLVSVFLARAERTSTREGNPSPASRQEAVGRVNLVLRLERMEASVSPDPVQPHAGHAIRTSHRCAATHPDGQARPPAHAHKKRRESKIRELKEIVTKALAKKMAKKGFQALLVQKKT